MKSHSTPWPTRKKKERQRRSRRAYIVRMAETHREIRYLPPEPNPTGDPFYLLRNLT